MSDLYRKLSAFRADKKTVAAMQFASDSLDEIPMQTGGFGLERRLCSISVPTVRVAPQRGS